VIGQEAPALHPRNTTTITRNTLLVIRF
jgi:hypothetical protein